MSFSPLSKLGIIQNQNYIPNSDFNNFPFASNATLGWSLKNGGTPDATTKLPTSAPSAAAAGTLSLSSVSGGSQISGTVSASLSSTAATTAGDMLITDALTLDTKAQATIQSFSFFYKVSANGTGTPNFSGTSSNAIGVAIYDATNSAWIQPAGVFNLVQSSGVGKATGTFQCPSNCTSVRLAVYFPNSTAASGGSPFTVIFDDFVLGPQGTVYGSPVTDWQSVSGMTAAGFGTPSVTSSFYRRVGDSYEYQVDITFGAAGTGAELNITLPSGVSIDVNKEPSAGIRTAIGDGVYRNTGSGAIQTGVVYYATGVVGVTVVTFYTTSVTVASGHTIGMTFRVPVSGLSSSVSMSNDTDTRVVALSASGTATGTIATSFASSGNANFPTATLNTHATYASGVYTIPVSGIYSISGNLNVIATFSTNYFDVGLFIDGTATDSQTSIPASGVAINQAIPFKFLRQLNAGQTISVRPQTNAGSPTYGANGRLIVERLSGPATIAASETNAASAGSSAGNSIANATLTFIDFPTATINTHGAITGAGSGNNTTYTSTWRFIAPISGTYLVSANITVVQSAATTTSLDTLCIIAKNGVGLLNGQRQNLASTVASTGYGSNVSGLIKANAGDAISIIGYQSNPGSTARNMEANSQANFVSIVRVGN
jgi:hypothetical protein